MCFKTMNFDTIKFYALFDITLTILTVILAIHIFNLHSELVEAEKKKYNERKLQDLEFESRNIYDMGKKTAKGLVYCFILAPMVLLLVDVSIICCSCCTKDIDMIYQTLKLWIPMECMFLVGMTIMYFELYSYIQIDHVNVIEGPEIRIPYAICYISRLILILIIIVKMILYKRQRTVPAAADIEIM